MSIKPPIPQTDTSRIMRRIISTEDDLSRAKARVALLEKVAKSQRDQLLKLWNPKVAKRPYKRRRTRKIRPINHGKPWNETDRRRAQMIGHKYSDIAELATSLGRTVYSIEWQRNLYLESLKS